MIERTLFRQDHEAFRNSFKRFLHEEVAPYHAAWEEDGRVNRGVWKKAGTMGFLCASLPQEYGGSGTDKLFAVVQIEELARSGFTGIGFNLHSEIVAPYILRYGTETQKKRLLPKLASGELIGAIAMTEPDAGSDLQGIKTTALKQADGSYLLNGHKTYVTNGWHADVIIVVAITTPGAGAKGTSLLMIEREMEGLTYGQPRKKLGLKAQDTGDLYFNDIILTSDNLLGGADFENKGFACLMAELPWERTQIAVTAVAASQAAIDETLKYVKERQAFGQTVGDFQHTRFKLAELQTEVQIAQVFLDKCLELMLQGKLDASTASMAKYWATDLQCKVMDECLQLHGGYGFMWDCPVARAFADARVQRIYGGTNEIMKEVISRSIGLRG